LSAGAVGAGSVPGGAFGAARFSILLVGEGRVPSRVYTFVAKTKADAGGASDLIASLATSEEHTNRPGLVSLKAYCDMFWRAHHKNP
jgi:hypothetical protein